MSKIDASGIRRVFDLAAKLENPINFSIGQPDFDIPEEIRQAGINAIQSGFNKYTQTQGIPELNSAIKEMLKAEMGYRPEATVVTSGVSGALLLLIMTLVNPGDEVIIPDPYFVMYKHLVNLMDGVPVYVDTRPDFKLNADKIAVAVTSKTKLILLNSPSNPTGIVTDNDTLKKIGDIVKGTDIIIASDEIYRRFIYEGKPTSIAKYAPDNTILMDGFSKSVAMTGWRVGYAAGTQEIIAEMSKLQQYTFVCAPSFAQKAALQALTRTNKHLDGYRKRRDLIFQGLTDIGYKVNKPGGAFYIFPEAPYDEDRFIENAVANNLLIIPGSVFSENRGHFRISYSTSEETIKKGLEVLKKIKDMG